MNLTLRGGAVVVFGPCLVYLILPCLFLLLSIDSDEVGELGLFLALTNLNNDPHNNIFEAVLAVGLSIGYAIYFILGQVHHIVTGEFTFLLQDLVLIYEQTLSKRLILVLLNELLHLFVGEHEELSISQTPKVHIGVILHKEGTMVDG